MSETRKHTKGPFSNWACVLYQVKSRKYILLKTDGENVIMLEIRKHTNVQSKPKP